MREWVARPTVLMVTRVIRRLELRESWRAVVECRDSAVDCRLVTVLYRTHNTSKNLACVVKYMGDAYACPCMPRINSTGGTYYLIWGTMHHASCTRMHACMHRFKDSK